MHKNSVFENEWKKSAFDNGLHCLKIRLKRETGLKGFFLHSMVPLKLFQSVLQRSCNRIADIIIWRYSLRFAVIKKICLQ